MNRQWTRRLAAGLGLLSGLLLTTTAGAQTPGGVIAFFDSCNNRPYVMRGDGTGRVRLADAHVTPVDITRGGWPMSVVTYDLYAVDVTDIAGQLEVGLLVSLRPPGDPACTDAALSPDGNRIAYMTSGLDNMGYPKTFWIADLVRDGAGRITGAANRRLLTTSEEIGSPSDIVEGSPIYDGLALMTFSPDGTSLLVAVYGDLWRLYLTADGTLLYPERVTQTRTRVEWGPAFSPDGRKLAFTAFDLKYNKTGLLKGTYSMGPGKIYTLPLDSPATPVPLLNTNNLGEAKDSIYGFRNPTWSPDGAYIAFWAAGGKSVKPPCASAGNTDIFVTRADGSGLATALTKTPTTSNERVPRWGW